MAGINEHDFLTKAKIKMAEICANFRSSSDESVDFFDPNRHPLYVLFTPDFEKLYQEDYGYGSFQTCRNLHILKIAQSCLDKLVFSLSTGVRIESESIIIENHCTKNPGILTLTPIGKFIFSIGEVTYPEFNVDEIFDKKKEIFIINEVLVETNMKDDEHASLMRFLIKKKSIANQVNHK